VICLCKFFEVIYNDKTKQFTSFVDGTSFTIDPTTIIDELKEWMKGC